VYVFISRAEACTIVLASEVNHMKQVYSISAMPKE
jgi:hypothetical protein